MAIVDWTNVNLYYYLAAGGAVLALLAMFADARSGSKGGVPAVVLSAIGGLGAGLALGVILMGLMGYRMVRPVAPEPGSADDPRQVFARSGAGPAMPMPGMGGPGGPGGPANTKVQLANLVGKIHLLTGKPLALALNDEQGRKVREQLVGLDQLEELDEEDAKKRLDALTTALSEAKEMLDAVNYRWAGGAGGPPRPGGGTPPVTNPFKEGAARDQVQSLQKRLEPRKAGDKGS